MKKVLNLMGNVIAWVLLIFALIITILVFSSDRNNGVATLAGYIPLTVESDSMSPTFFENDLIICREVTDVKELKEGDVITFWTIINGRRVKNTHRIVNINDVNGNLSFVTRGDANSINDDLSVYAVDVIGKWTDVKIKGFGKAMDYLRTKSGFFICILLPMILFFLFELYKMIAVVVEIRQPQISESEEEEIKRKAIEEYIAQQKNSEKDNE